MGTARSNLALALAVACCLGLTALETRPVLAQLDRGTRARALDAFDSYDLEGPETLEALALLSDEMRDGRVVVGAPRLAHARAATDLWLLSWLDPERAHLEQDLAAALGVPSFALVGTLHDALDAVADEELSAEASGLAEAIELRRAIESGEAVSFASTPAGAEAGTAGVRRDAILVHLVGTAIEDGDDAELEAWYDDPCAVEGACDAPWSEWSASSRTIVAALVDAAGALGRLDEAWEAGDAFARAVLPALRDDARRLELHVHAPAPASPEAVEPLEAVGIREGRLVAVDRGEGGAVGDAPIPPP